MKSRLHSGALTYRDEHTVESDLVWSPDSRSLAFIVDVYDFEWGGEGTDHEVREDGNHRAFLAIISADRPAVGYRITHSIDEPKVKWLDNSRIEVKSAVRESESRDVFQLLANPPKPIP
uniref:Uncharacterized protein n=1 Tax=Solibacter usitatus (strain Ellin6076) TaxID=234267 RepID=Q028U1_SOLUE